jgi:hypothetical protein
MMLDYLDHSARSACKAWGIHLVAGLGSQLRWTMVKNRQRPITRSESAVSKRSNQALCKIFCTLIYLDLV